MIKHYLKIALQNITAHKAFSIINIAGLTIETALANPVESLRSE